MRWLLFGQVFGNVGLILILKSGHTGHEDNTFCSRAEYISEYNVLTSDKKIIHGRNNAHC